MIDKPNIDINNLSEDDLNLLEVEDLDSAFGSVLQAGSAFLLAKGSCSKSWDYC